MSAIRRWLSRPALTYGDIVAIVAIVAAANGIRVLTGISDNMTLLLVIGLVIAERIGREFYGRSRNRKDARP